MRPRINIFPEKVQAKEISAMYKIIMIGDSSTGKTSLLLKFCDNNFDFGQNQSTIGIDFKLKNIKIDKKIVKLQLWDTAGQERFKSMSNSYIRNAHGCVAVYDITRRESFLSLEK